MQNKLFLLQGTTSMTLKFNYPFCGRLGKRFEGLVLHEVRRQIVDSRASNLIFLSFSMPLVWSTPRLGRTGTTISSRWMVVTLMLLHWCWCTDAGALMLMHWCWCTDADALMLILRGNSPMNIFFQCEYGGSESEPPISVRPTLLFLPCEIYRIFITGHLNSCFVLIFQTFGLPYECDSVMHYGYKDFAAIGRWEP